MFCRFAGRTRGAGATGFQCLHFIGTAWGAEGAGSARDHGNMSKFNSGGEVDIPKNATELMLQKQINRTRGIGDDHISDRHGMVF